MTSLQSASTTLLSTSQPLDGMVVIVTGGGRGLGAAISADAAHAGADVVLVGRNRDSLTNHARDLPGSPFVFDIDVTAAGSADAVIDAVIKRFGRLDGLVNNAGSAHFGPATAITEDGCDAILALDVRAPLLLAGRAAAAMTNGGSIVNISSAMAEVGQPGTSLYAAGKGAIDAATRALAAELGAMNIRVNGVRPGLTRTDATAYAYQDSALMDAYHRSVPLGRTGEAHDVVGLTTFLLSPAAAFITGQTITVDGGHTTSKMINPM
ncbi:SDR family NAD(P)-dependent oxidoreductase [Streptomyces acidicola]|uniref:SDR family NAD(P)-dependent oxidoreductase n=1 Tax=Streptomyces acidicola TaxID=2596892 RepID=UPI00380BE837